MRQLNKIEKELNRKSIIRMTKENEGAEYLLEVEELQLKKGLKLSYEANITASQNKVKNYKATVESNNTQIQNLKDQNAKGVEEKKQPSSVG